MSSRLPSLTGSVIAFGHRGASAQAPENTMESFRLALTLGATGLETDVWVTADGVPVLDGDGAVGRRLRRRPISSLKAADLPDATPRLTDLLDLTEGRRPISLNLGTASAFDAVVETARRWGPEAETNLWLSHRELEVLAEWRPRTSANLVNTTRLGRINEGIERRLSHLHDADIEALSMFHSDWTGGTVALAHRFEILAFGWGARHARELSAVIDAGIDAVYSDRVDRLVSAVDQYY